MIVGTGPSPRKGKPQRICFARGAGRLYNPGMDWGTMRQEVPAAARWAYFDHAAVAPLTSRAVAALTDWATDTAANGVVHWAAWQHRVEEARRRAAALLNADHLDLAFIKNTSEGVGIVAEGLRWRPGDNVVTAQDEYPANVYPWLNLTQRGVEMRRVPSQQGRLLIDDVRAAIDSRTRLVTLSHVEFATGFRNDLEKLGGLCREKNVLFFVDAIQGLGTFPIDVQQVPIDFLAADGHKWLLGPEGAGVLFVRRERVEELHAVGVGWNSVVGAHDFDHVELKLKPHAGRWESGSLNVGGIVALGGSLELLLEAGVLAISARVLEVTDRLCSQIGRLGLDVFSSRLPGEASGIVSVVVPGDVRALVRRLREEGFVTNQRAGRLRLSPHAYNTVDEIDRLCLRIGGFLQ